MKKSRWIPVAERLPEVDKEVLVWMDTEQHGKNACCFIGFLEENERPDNPDGKHNFWEIPSYGGRWTIWGFSYFEKPNVLAWMELPEPYCEKEERGFLRRALDWFAGATRRKGKE